MTVSPLKTCLLLLLILAAVAVPVSGASIVLREQATPSGAVLFLGDIADIAAASEEEMHNLATTPLMAAPAHGTQEFLHFAKVLDLLEVRGVDVSELSFAGARTVEIGKTIAVEVPVAIEPAKPSMPLMPVECEEAVTNAIIERLVNITGHQDWEVELNLSAAELREVGKLGADLTASAGRSPWIGTQKFQIAGGGDNAFFVVAKVTRLRNVVVAIRRIDQGSLIGAADVEMRLEGKNVPTTAVQSLDLVIGKEAVRTIEADTVLQPIQTRSPMQVQRGETVKVFARTGGITVSTFAIVQQNGALGDLVQVQTLDKKQRFAARVSGWKQLEVLPTGVTTADYEALNRPETLKR